MTMTNKAALRAAMVKSMVAAIQANAGGSVTSSAALARQLAGGYGPPSNPLMARYNIGTGLGASGLTMLPRDPRAFIGGQFNPSLPSPIYPVDPSQPKSGRPLPRQYEYQIGHNLPTSPDSQKLIPFKVLRKLAQSYDIAALCIDARKNEIAGLDWDIVPREDADQGKGRSQRVNSSKISSTTSTPPGKPDSDLRKQILKFFRTPDPIRGLSMRSWLSAALDDVLVIDALAIYEHPTLKGDLFALELLDGSTIKPLIDERGTRPLPPNPAYQQFIYGIPRSEFIALLLDAADDPEVQALQRGMPGPDDEFDSGMYTADQLAYKVFRPRNWTHYGFSNIEQIIININVALKRQDWHLSYFTDGDIPAMLLAAPETWNPDQIQRYEAMWHSMLSNDNGWKHRVRVIPGVQKAEMLKPPVHDMKFDEWMARITCAGFGMDPGELGLVGNTESENQAAAAAARRARLATMPTVQFFQGYFDSVIERRFNTDDWVFRFDADELNDRLMELNIDSGLAKLGGMSLNEMRAKRGMARIDDVHADKPNVYLTRDIVPVDQIGTLIGAQLDAGMAPGTGTPSGGAMSNNTPTPRAGGGSASGGSATNAKRSPSSGKTSTNKIADAQDELRQLEKFIGKSRARRFVPEHLPASLVDRVYSRVAEGEEIKTIFADIRANQAIVADDVLGDIVERLLEQ
jgi:hypothetical protein